ncbi:hypothetical protein JKF63_07249 [Porcisia hertigi]|uniref:cDENN domain-containing protein n=1 Tax=Porcisia hertigi TaxID=2761500 RepID=A0A836YHU2_9TRYP|nr:hypothetical protein JKF63_07249 [Porcisia hertigi]
MSSGARSVSGGDAIGGGGGVPLITHLLLLRATVRFSVTPPEPSTLSAAETALMTPKLRVVSLYTQRSASTSTSPPHPMTATPQEETQFLEAHPSLSGLLSSLAAGRLAERVKLRRLQTNILQTAVKLIRVAALASSTEAISASGSVSSSSSSRGVDTGQLHGVVAAAAANFVEDASWSSTITSHHQQPNPWSLLPVSAEGCYLTVPTPPFVHWCQEQAMRGGAMRYDDTVHYASVAEDGGYMHGYAFILEGDEFTGRSGIEEATTTTAEAAMASSEGQGLEASLRNDSDEEASVLLWCVLSDAPVYNFMCALAHGAVAAMCFVAQRLFRERVVPTASSSGANPSLPRDIYTALLDDAIQDRVVRPLAMELLTPGSVSSRTLPGDTFSVQLPLSGGNSGAADPSIPLTFSVPDRLTFHRPLDLLYPHADVPLSLLLLSFNEDALRVLQSLLLQEERVVVLGATPQHASACVISLLALLSPLTWVSPLVPYLPPHLTAVTGLLQSLLKPSSEREESSGFLVGSTAAIQPYLILFSSSASETDMNPDSHNHTGTRKSRVWIADARTGCVGVCPEEPIARFSRADAPPPPPPPTGSPSKVPATTATDKVSVLTAWVSRAHVSFSQIAPHINEDSRHRSVASLYKALCSDLRALAVSNVMGAAPLDLLPVFSDELRDTLRRVATAEKRRLFRHSLDAVVQHAQARLEGLESIAARLARGLRQATTTAAAVGNISVAATWNNSFAAPGTYRDPESGDGGLTAVRATDDDDDDTAWLRTTTEALTRLYSQSFSSADSSAAMSVAATPVPQFSTFSSSELWQVHVGVFDYMVSRFTGAYRRGLSTTTLGSGGASETGPRRPPKIESSAFLVPGMDNRYALAERVGNTHMFKQFECLVLEAEKLGLRQVLSGAAQTRVGGIQLPQHQGKGSEGHPALTNARSLALFSLLCSRARLHHAYLYADVASVDAVGDVYTSVVTRWFAHRRGSSMSVVVPGPVRLLAGGFGRSDNGTVGSADADTMHLAYNKNGLEEYRDSCSSSDGGGGRRLRGFLSKVAKVVKKGINSAGGSGHGSSGRARELPRVYLPAAIACMHTLSVPLFSQMPVPPHSFAITYSESTPLESNKGEASGRLGRHRHRRQCDAQAYLAACTSRPQRMQWVRQQQQQQSIALDADFTLHDSESNIRAVDLSGGRRAQMSDLGIDSAMFDAITRTESDPGNGRGKVGIGADAPLCESDLRAASEASLYICRALPLDIVHSFDAYEPLLRPVPSKSADTPSVSFGGGTVGPGSAETYMRVGLLCPLCINVWREIEARATRDLLEQSCPHTTKSPAALSPTSPAPPGLPPPPRSEKPAETPTPQDSLWSFPAAPQLTAPPVTTEPTVPMEASVPSAWGVFTSGVPQDYISWRPAEPSRCHGVDTPPQQQQQQHPPASTRTSTVDSSPRSRADRSAAPLASNSTSPSRSTPHHHHVWDVKGPLVITSVQSTPMRTTATEWANTQTATYDCWSDSEGGVWSSGAPLAPPMMLSGIKTASPPNAFACSPTPAAGVAPTPSTVMDDLFAEHPVYPSVHAAAPEKSSQQPEQQIKSTAAAHHLRMQSLNDFF